jgi:glucoamylase
MIGTPPAPGIPPTWTSSAKDMVGCALGSSRLWFTLGFGIVNEVYYPRVDIPQIRDFGLIVADGEGFRAEVKRVADYQLRLLASGVPAVEIVHRHQRYSLLLRIAPGSRRDVLAIECRLDGDQKLRLYALLTPHLGRHRLRQPCCDCLASRPTNLVGRAGAVRRRSRRGRRAPA